MPEQPTNETALSAVKALESQSKIIPRGQEAETATKRTIESLGGMALQSNDKAVQIAALKALGGFNGIQQEAPGNMSEASRLKPTAIDMAIAIGVKTNDEETIMAAVDAIAPTLNTVEAWGTTHNAAVMGIGSVAVNAQESVRKHAIEILSAYQQKPLESRGYAGSTADAKAQALASPIVAVLGENRT